MNSKRAKALKVEARRRGMTGKVVISEEYKRLKRSHDNPRYATNKVNHPSKPGRLFTGKMRKERAKQKGISVHKLLTA